MRRAHGSGPQTSTRRCCSTPKGGRVLRSRDWLARTALLTPERAAKKLEFLEHPLWRTYVFVYTEGAALLERWLGQVPSGDRPARYRRLLVEPLTPTAIERELATG